MALALLNPIPQFFDTDGTPLDAGKLYFGTANADPLTSPVQVYWDAAATIPAAQPVRTLNGYPSRSGAPAAVFTNGNVSLLVRNSRDVQVASIASSAASDNASSLAADLAAFKASLLNTASAVLGPALVAWSHILTYAKGSIGWAVNLFQPKANLWTYLTDAQIADSQSGATPTIAIDAALASLWSAVQTKGGIATIPPGNYLKTGTWVKAITAPVNIKVQATGAMFYDSAAVTGASVQVYSSYNQYALDIVGLGFNHRGNTTAQGCIEVKGGHNVTIDRCSVERHNTKAGHYLVKLASSATGASEDDYNSFWCRVTNCNTRMRSGGDGTPGEYGLLIEGAANATTSSGNIWSDCVRGVHAIPAPTTKTIANSLIVEKDSFESVTTSAVSCAGLPAEYGPTGWRILFNRVETCPTFFDITTGGAAMLQASQPVFMMGNYCTAGSVTTWVNNPTAYPVSLLETRTPGFGPSVQNRIYMGGGMTFTFTDGNGLTLTDASGSTDYSTGWLAQGTFRYWTNTASTKLYIKTGTPANNTDGAIVGP